MLRQTIKAAVRSRYFWQWTIVTIGGSLVALVASQIVLLLAQYLSLLQNPGFGILLGLCLGLSIGIFQWYVLRKYFSKAYGWIVATGLSAVLSVFLQDFVARTVFDSFASQLFASATFAGLLTGVAQWTFLTSKVKNAWIWIPATVVAQLLSSATLLASFSIERTTAPSTFVMIQFIAFIVGQVILNGLILGAVTGVPMSFFIRQRD